MSSIQRQRQFDIVYLKMALAMSQLSYARRKKVGAIIVNPNGQIIAQGFNGTPSGMDNNCEYDWCSAKNKPVESKHCKCSCMTDVKYNRTICSECSNYRLKTKPYVLHAETNAISKCARSNQSTDGATLYVTLSPCIDCAKSIIQAGIKRVVYYEYYNNPEGIDLLNSVGINVDMIDDLNDIEYCCGE